jgi:proline dehydrogenase
MWVDGGHRVRIYVPYGEDRYAYSVRRFKENPQLAHYAAADVLAWTRRRRRSR